MHPLLIILWFFYLSQAINARDTITPIQPLANNETLISADGRFALGFFTRTPAGKSDKNHWYVGLWYNKIADKTPLWVANREKPVTSSTGFLSISSSGELRITDQNSTVLVWSSGNVSNVADPVAQLLNSGNLVVREASSSSDGGNFAWQGFDYPTDTLIAGMKMGVDFVTGLNRTLTAWTSESDPSPSQLYAMMDIHGDPQIVLCSGSKKVYRSGPWNGLRFSGIPAMLTYYGLNVSFINNKKEISYSFNTIPSVLSKLAVNQSGVLQRSLWVEGAGLWNIIWHASMDDCDGIPPCGPFATCNPNNVPICDCIQGFKPKSPDQWMYRDAAEGCVRKTRLDCQNRTDGFFVIPNTKLPDTSNVMVDTSLMSMDDCKAKCLSNCSCTAYAPADVRNGGSGCIIWTNELTDLKVLTVDAHGQELYIRLAAADLGQLPTTARKSKKWIYVLVIILAFFMVILAYVGNLLWRRSKRRTRAMEEINTTFGDHRTNQGFVSGTDLELFGGSDLELPLLDLKTVTFATDNFSLANKLGEGGFGPVFKGKLGNGQEIAVKRLAKTSVQGLVEFKNEVLLIAKLQHRNLVRLLACCIEEDERILIYEYMPNKSLDYFLFEKSKDHVLDWQTRFKIIMGIARGLLYLHQDSRLRIIHRDLKASNILLDEEMNPKISDFGMARIFYGDEVLGNTMKIVGTFGYISPEYAMDGIFSQKSDGFSFGVLVLEIITG